MADVNYFHTNQFCQKTQPHVVFGLPSKGYSVEDVNCAYKKLIRLYHPDKHSTSAHQTRFETIAKFINKKRAQILQGLRRREMEPDNPAGEEVNFEVIPDWVVLYRSETTKKSQDSEDDEEQDDGQDEDEDEEGEDEDEDEEEYVDMEDDADTQGVQFNPQYGSTNGEEQSSNGNGTTHGFSDTTSAATDMCICKSRLPHYHLVFEAAGMAPNTIGCPLCPTTLPNTTANKGSLAQHVKTVHKQRCYTMDPNKKPPMSSKERVRKFRAKKNALNNALVPIG